MKHLALLALLLSGCGLFKTEEAKKPDPMPELRERMATYCELSKPRYLVTGHITDECDAAGFTALHGLACDYVTINQFEDEPGKLCRKPGCTCFADGEDRGSKSNWSKDMEIMTQTYLTVRPYPDLVGRRIEYGVENQWVVCEALDDVEKVSRCVMSPKLINNWYELRSASLTTAQDSDDALPIKTGFQAHLDMVSIIFDWRLYGKISPSQVDLIKRQVRREPENGVFRALAARFAGASQAKAARLLLDKFPADRLPNNGDWCEPYLYQRDRDLKDWLPCAEPTREHWGTDFLVAAWILTIE